MSLTALASLRTRHQGPSIMGFEDEVEQSFGRPCRQCDGRFKRLYELTSSIVPRGTSFHRGRARFPPIAPHQQAGHMTAVSIPITAMPALSLCDMACSSSLTPLASFPCWRGPEHGWTIPLAVIRVAPQGLQIALIPPDGGSLIRYSAIRS